MLKAMPDSVSQSTMPPTYIKRVDGKSIEAMGRLEVELRKPVQSDKGTARSAKAKAPRADAAVRVGLA
jgi:hypothetical protein